MKNKPQVAPDSAWSYIAMNEAEQGTIKVEVDERVINQRIMH